MAFNHYAKMKRILSTEPSGWVIRRIDQPTQAKNFKGETVNYDHFYRIYRANGEQIPYCKFQKIDKLASTLGTTSDDLPLVT